jgi:hypothetical protein
MITSYNYYVTGLTEKKNGRIERIVLDYIRLIGTHQVNNALLSIKREYGSEFSSIQLEKE